MNKRSLLYLCNTLLTAGAVLFLTQTGVASNQAFVPTIAGTKPQVITVIDSGDNMQIPVYIPTDRTIFTAFDANGDGHIGRKESIKFTEENSSILRPLLRLPQDENSEKRTLELIKWFRERHIGSHSDRSFRGIVYSSPLVVGTPPLGAVSSNDPDVESFWRYLNEIIGEDCVKRQDSNCKPYTKRKKMIYAGADDGMLHAFVLSVWDENRRAWITKPEESPEIGRELWAYMPSNQLSTLKELADRDCDFRDAGERSSVDLMARAWDVFIQDPIDPSKESWRTVLIGGQRNGGDAYFAIDITDPDKPILLWEYSVLKEFISIDPSGNRLKASAPFRDKYGNLKAVPVSCSNPYVGRIKIPPGLKFYIGDPNEGFPTGESSIREPKRHVAFVGVGMGYRNAEDNSILPPEYLRNSHSYPQLLAIDIQTGQNLFKYVWPYMVAKNKQLLGLGEGSYENAVPCAIADPVCLDLTDSEGNISPDGFVDHIFMGDLAGNFYGLKIRQKSSSEPLLSLDIWKTKGKTGGKRQPITVMPTASVSRDGNFLHVIFGTGKDEAGNHADADDTPDMGMMSLYNIKIPINLTPNSAIKHQVYDSNLSFQVQPKGPNEDLANAVVWTGRKDKTFANSSSSLAHNFGFGTAFDANGNPVSLAGERVIDRALIVGGLVFVTTYIPEKDAGNGSTQNSASGHSYLYVFDYEGGYFSEDFTPFPRNAEENNGIQFLFESDSSPETIAAANTNSESYSLGSTPASRLNSSNSDAGSSSDSSEGSDLGPNIGPDSNTNSGPNSNHAGKLEANANFQKTNRSKGQPFGARFYLGRGMPSRPSIDSTGTQIFTQVGGQLKKIRINLNRPAFELRGWKIR